MEYYLIIILQLAILFAAFLIYKKIGGRKPESHQPKRRKRHDPIRPDQLSSKGFIISLEKAHLMVQEYRNPKQARQDPDARSGWYPKGVLRDYINYVEDYSNLLNISVTGIRYYYAAYPNGDSGGQGGYQTMVFFPTTLKNGKDVGFDPGRSSMDMPYFVDDILSEPINPKNLGDTDGAPSMHYISGVTNISDGALNRASMCPPSNNC